MEIYNIKGEGVKMLLTIEIEVWWKYIYIYKLKMPLTWFIRKDGNIWGGGGEGVYDLALLDSKLALFL